MKAPRIAVIGAGIAGLAAARRLSGAGSRVVVFDKARGPGGRVSTRRAEAFAFDHGAQYFTCRGPAFRELVAEWCKRGVAARWEVPVAALCQGARSEARGDETRYVGVPRMSALTRSLAAELLVECGERIERVERSAGGWSVTSESSARFDGFDAVVIATPAPQAVPLLAAAPSFQERVASVEMEPCHAVMVAFARPLEVDFAAAFVERSPLAWVARNDSKPGRPGADCWVLHTTPDWSRDWLDASAAQVIEASLQAFAVALGRALPATTHADSHRWLYARTSRPLGEPFLWDADASLGVCGDWAFGGRVENAFLSGDLLAGAMSFDSE